LSRADCKDTNFAQGSQPLSPTTALKLAGYGFPFPYFPRVKQVPEYSAVAAPMLKPPTPSLTVKITHRSYQNYETKIISTSQNYRTKVALGNQMGCN
jgi:hypothetical protein